MIEGGGGAAEDAKVKMLGSKADKVSLVLADSMSEAAQGGSRDGWEGGGAAEVGAAEAGAADKGPEGRDVGAHGTAAGSVVDIEAAGAAGGSQAGTPAQAGKLRKSPKGLTFWQGLMISLNYNLGFSVLLFPFMIASAGWVGYAILFGACFVTFTTARFIATMMVEYPRIHTYSDLGKMAARVQFRGSRRAENIVLGAFRVFQTVELFMYLLFAVVSVQEALLLLVPNMAPAVAAGCTYAMIGAMIISTLSARALAVAGTLGVVTFFLTLGLLVTASLTHIGRADVSANVASMYTLNSDLKRFFGAYGGILLLFSGHAVYPSVFNALEDRANCMRVVNWTYICMMAFCIVPSMLAILAFGPHAMTDLPTGYLEYDEQLNIIGQVFLITKMVTGAGPIMYPIIIEVSVLATKRLNRPTRPIEQPLSPGLQSNGEIERRPSIDSETETTARMRLVVGFCVVSLSMLLGLVLPSLSFVVSLTSALFAVALCLTLPSLTFICTVPFEKDPWQVGLAYFLLVGGFASSVMAFYAIV
jgi:hypothetical protein